MHSSFLNSEARIVINVCMWLVADHRLSLHVILKVIIYFLTFEDQIPIFWQ